MSDFISEFWNWYVIIIVLVGVVGSGVFLWVQSSHRTSRKKTATTGHVWDETLEEYNNPMPQWWMWLYYITVVFSLVYLVLFPGLGNFPGILKWTSAGQYDNEKKAVDDEVKPIFDGYLKTDLNALASNGEAMDTARRLYSTYCMQCHGALGKGSATKGFPNLTNKKKRWGGDPEQIKESISEGRAGLMLPYGGDEETIGGEAGVKEVAQYVRSLANLPTANPEALVKGKEKFDQVCVACHQEDGKGMPELGAPDLTDSSTWIYGSTEEAIIDSIKFGRNNGTLGRDNQMPVWNELLRAGEIHLLSAYVLHLSK